MALVRTIDEVAGGALNGKETVFSPAEIFQVLYETKPEVIEAILPPPLKPYEKPYLLLVNSYFRETSFDAGLNGPGYKETGLYVPCYHNGLLGSYIAAMTLDSDMGSFLGREMSGLPKKIATHGISLKGDRYAAFSARHGIAYVTMEGMLDGRPNDENFLEEFKKVTYFDQNRPEETVNYSFKYSLGGAGRMFLTPPFLLQSYSIKKPLQPTRYGSAKINYMWSDDDPWAEAEVVRVLGCVYDVVDFRVSSEGGKSYLIDSKAFAPFALAGWDHMPRDEKWDK